ncbi:hypothetical protein ES708_29827 [subsurface metagenome]
MLSDCLFHCIFMKWMIMAIFIRHSKHLQGFTFGSCCKCKKTNVFQISIRFDFLKDLFINLIHIFGIQSLGFFKAVCAKNLFHFPCRNPTLRGTSRRNSKKNRNYAGSFHKFHKIQV